MIVQIYEQFSSANKNMIISLIVEPENPDKEDAHYGTRKVQLHLGDERVVIEVFPVGWQKSLREEQDKRSQI
jgi:hypothetical protein